MCLIHFFDALLCYYLTCIPATSRGADSTRYVAFLKSKLGELVAQKQLALDIYVGLQSRVPLSECNYSNPQNPAERVFLASSTMRTISDLQLQLSEMLIQVHLLHDVFTPSPVRSAAEGKLSAIEKYLENSRPLFTKGVVTLETFEASPASRAIATAADASRALTRSEHVLEANLFLATAVVAEKMAAGERMSSLGTNWHRRRGAADEGGEDREDASSVLSFDPTAFANEDSLAMATLESALLTGLAVRSPTRYSRSLLLGSLFLADASGKYSPAATASYLLNHQSLVAREWLLQTWRGVLNPSTEVAVALNRIDSLLNQGIAPDAKTQKRLSAEYSFLESASVAWQR